MNNETQVQIQNKFCLTIDEAVIYFNIAQRKESRDRGRVCLWVDD